MLQTSIKSNCLLFIIVSLFLGSCNKEKDGGTTNMQGPLLKTYVEMKDAQSNADTAKRVDYYYDSEKRLSHKIINNSLFYLQQGIFQYKYDSVVYLYSGKNILPYQVQEYFIGSFFNPAQFLTIKNTYYLYDSKGLLVFDSSYFQYNGNYEKFVSKYSYVNDTIFTDNKFNYYDLSYSAYKLKTRLTVCADNICKQNDSLYTNNGWPRNITSTREIKFKYDADANVFFYAKMQFPIWNSAQNSRKYIYEDICTFRKKLSEIDYAGGNGFGNMNYKQNFTYLKGINNEPEKVSYFGSDYNGSNANKTNIFLYY